MIKTLSRCLLAAVATCCVTHASAQPTPSYHLAGSVALGAPDRWDYVVADPASHRVFVAHGDRLTVVDAGSGAILGQVTGMPGGTHGIAISAATGRGYTDDGEAGLAKSFDLSSLQVTKSLPAAPDADAVAIDPLTGHVFTVNGDTGSLTVIDPVSNTVIATIKPGGKLEYAVADGAGKLYVNGAGASEILRVDTRTNQVDARWPVADCTSPHGLAIDTASHRLFSSCVNSRMIVVDTATGKEVARLPIGAGTDAAAFDPVRRRAFSSNGRAGTITVIQEGDGDTYSVLDTIKTAVSARTMGIDTSTGRLFVVAADLDPSSPATGRPKFVPGSAKLLMFDPSK